MKLIAVLMGVTVLLITSSCATGPKPLAPGELRLLSMQVPEEGKIRVNTPFLLNINFGADGEPQIRAACFSFSGDGPHCTKVTDVMYGSPGNIKVETRTTLRGSIHLECYVTYVRDGKIEATNVISTNFRLPEVTKPSQLRR